MGSGTGGVAVTPEEFAVVKSIDLSLRKLVVIAERKAEERVKAAQNAPGPAIAPDSDLDGSYGNPPVKFNPRDWTGDSCKGRTLSECPAEFLDMLAETFDYFAGKAEEKNEMTTSGKPVAPYKRKDAARCRGWAARIRAGKVAAPKAGAPAWSDPDAGSDSNDSVPW